MHNDKAGIRKQILSIRKQLDPLACNQASQRILNQFIKADILANCQHIAVYRSFGNEIDLDPLIQILRTANKTIYLPLLHPSSQNSLCFAIFTKGTKLRTNKFGILEPFYEASNIKSPHELDAIILPLVAFDKHGHRLGMGKGYYDKSLSFKKANQGPLLIGAAYEFQKVPPLIAEPWDIALDCVVTEKDFYDFREK